VGEYLPDVYVEFTERYPQVAEAQGELARAVRDATPFDERTTRLLKLALALGAHADGAVRSNVRKKGPRARRDRGGTARRDAAGDHHLRVPQRGRGPALDR
jgi:hypothetical protein